MSKKAAGIWVGASALFMLIGAFGPWAKAFGVFSVSGTDGDGVIVVIAGLVIAAMVLLRVKGMARGWTVVVAILAGIAGTVTSVYDMATIQNAIGNSELHGVVSVGWGLWIDCIASVSAIVALLFLIRARDSQPMSISAQAPSLRP